VRLAPGDPELLYRVALRRRQAGDLDGAQTVLQASLVGRDFPAKAEAQALLDNLQ
jgi:hypothetical protein